MAYSAWSFLASRALYLRRPLTLTEPTPATFPGNFTGSYWTGITTRRTVSGLRQLPSRDTQTGVEAPMVAFGITNDSSIGGDYVGEGISDHGIWRGTPAPSKFEVRISSGASNMPPTVWSWSEHGLSGGGVEGAVMG